MNKNLNYTNNDNYNIFIGAPPTNPCLNNTCSSVCIDGQCQDKCPNGCPPCCSCGDAGCEPDYDTNKCEKCDSTTCSVVSTCDEKRCQECDGKGKCVSSCTPCQKCAGIGGCVDRCDKELCLSCDEDTGQCIKSCKNCESCYKGQCVDNCPGGCDECTSKGCVSKCKACETCIGSKCVPSNSPCKACETCTVMPKGFACKSNCEGCSYCADNGSCMPDHALKEPCAICTDDGILTGDAACQNSDECSRCGAKGQCRSYCYGCEICVNGECEDSCKIENCEECRNGKCESRCESCQKCSGGYCVSDCPDGACSHCRNGECRPNCKPRRCEECVGVDSDGAPICKSTCGPCDRCTKARDDTYSCVSACDPDLCQQCSSGGVCRTTCLDSQDGYGLSCGICVDGECRLDPCPPRYCAGTRAIWGSCLGLNGGCFINSQECPGPCPTCNAGRCGDGKRPKTCIDMCNSGCDEGACAGDQVGCCRQEVKCGKWDRSEMNLISSTTVKEDGGYCRTTKVFEQLDFYISCRPELGGCDMTGRDISSQIVTDVSVHCCKGDDCCEYKYGDACCQFDRINYNPVCCTSHASYNEACCEDAEGLCCLEPNNECCGDNPPPICDCLEDRNSGGPDCCIHKDNPSIYECCLNSFNQLATCCEGSPTYDENCCGNDQSCCTSNDDYNPACCESSADYDEACCNDPTGPCCTGDDKCCPTSASYDIKCCENEACCIGDIAYDKDCCERNECCRSSDHCCGVECENDPKSGCSKSCRNGVCVIDNPCCNDSDPACCTLDGSDPCPKLEKCGSYCQKGVCVYYGACCPEDPTYNPDCCPDTYDACGCSYPNGCPSIGECAQSCKDGECIKEDPCCNHECPVDIDGCSHECSAVGSIAVCFKQDKCCGKDCEPDAFGCPQTCKDGACVPEEDPVCCSSHPSYDKECCDGGDCCEDNPNARLECCESSDSYDKACCENSSCCPDQEDRTCCPSSPDYNAACCPTSALFDEECCKASIDGDAAKVACCKNPDSECCKNPDSCCDPECTSDGDGCEHVCVKGQCVKSDPCCGVICGTPDCEQTCEGGVCINKDPCCGESKCCDSDDPCCQIHEAGGCSEIFGCASTCKDGRCVKEDPCCGTTCSGCEICVDGECESTCNNNEDIGCLETCINGSCEKYNACCGIDCNDGGATGCRYDCIGGICVPEDVCCDPRTKRCCDTAEKGQFGQAISSNCCVAYALAQAAGDRNWPPPLITTNIDENGNIIATSCDQRCLDTNFGFTLVQIDPCCGS